MRRIHDLLTMPPTCPHCEMEIEYLQYQCRRVEAEYGTLQLSTGSEDTDETDFIEAYDYEYECPECNRSISYEEKEALERAARNERERTNTPHPRATGDPSTPTGTIQGGLEKSILTLGSTHSQQRGFYRPEPQAQNNLFTAIWAICPQCHHEQTVNGSKFAKDATESIICHQCRNEYSKPKN